jgi:hypothetical protein
MWYKFENGEWLYGNTVLFPDGELLEDNHDDTRDGWEWYDVSPIPQEDAE